MTEWYVIDARTGRIVTCVTSRTSPDVSGWLNGEHLTVDPCPSQAALNGYRYYTERP